MTYERLADIEEQFSTGIVIDNVGKKLVHDLIASLRAERQKVAELEKNNKKLRDAIAVLNCMIFCGEQHSTRTESMVNDALGFKSL
jgi:hypothetical protein